MPSAKHFKIALLATALALPLLATGTYAPMAESRAWAQGLSAQGQTGVQPTSQLTAQTPPSQLRGLSSYLLPQADQRAYSDVELYNIASNNPALGPLDVVLRLMRAEIYARKGQRFNDTNLASYFGAQGWYSAKSGSVSLSATELANVTAIQKMEGQLAQKGAITLNPDQIDQVVASAAQVPALPPEVGSPPANLPPVAASAQALAAVPGAAIPPSRLAQANAALDQQLAANRKVVELPRGPMPQIPTAEEIAESEKVSEPVVQDPKNLQAVLIPEGPLVQPAGTVVSGPHIAPSPGLVDAAVLAQHIPAGPAANSARLTPDTQGHPTAPVFTAADVQKNIAMSALGYTLPSTAAVQMAAANAANQSGAPANTQIPVQPSASAVFGPAATGYATPQLAAPWMLPPGAMPAMMPGLMPGMVPMQAMPGLSAGAYYAQNSMPGYNTYGTVALGNTLIIPEKTGATPAPAVASNTGTASPTNTGAGVVATQSSSTTTQVTTQVSGPRSSMILPASSQRALSEDEILANVTRRGDLGNPLAVLRLARNEIFARKGRPFRSPQLQDYFHSQDWYRANQGPVRLSSVEKKNVGTILRLERERLGERVYRDGQVSVTTTTTSSQYSSGASGTADLSAIPSGSAPVAASQPDSSNIANTYIGTINATPSGASAGSLNPSQYSRLDQPTLAPIFSPGLPNASYTPLVAPSSGSLGLPGTSYNASDAIDSQAPRMFRKVGAEAPLLGETGSSAFLLQDSDHRRLSEPEVMAKVRALGGLGSPQAILRLMRNEVFARSGYTFNQPDLKSYFEQQSWYVARHRSLELNPIAEANVALIHALEKAAETEVSASVHKKPGLEDATPLTAQVITGPMPGMMPGMMPNMMPVMAPGMMPNAMPGAMPSVMPSAIPGAVPVMAPGIPGMPAMMAQPMGAPVMPGYATPGQMAQPYAAPSNAAQAPQVGAYRYTLPQPLDLNPSALYPLTQPIPQGNDPRVAVAGKAGTAALYRAAAPQNGNTGFFLMPETQSRLVSAPEVLAVADSFSHLGSPGEVIRLIRAEIYARYGFTFQQGDLAAYFAQQPWYRSQNTIFSLTPVEEHNYNLIEALERRVGI